MSTYYIGPLSGTIVSRNNLTVTSSAPTDVFRFNLNGSRQIGLFLHDMTADADLSLYRDNNNNGLVDSSDTYLRGSSFGGTTADSIDYSATSGNYLAQVRRFYPAPSITYDLDLSSNYDIGTLGSSMISRNGYNVSASERADVFEFDVTGSRNLDIEINNISIGDDVDLYLYNDSNSNGIFDADDSQVASATRGSNTDDPINYQTSGSGTYFAQARRYSGSGSATYDIDFLSKLPGSADEYLTGDWDGDGTDELAVRVGNAVYMDYGNDGIADFTQHYGLGNAEDEYLVGDWDGDGDDNLAVRRGNKVYMDTNFSGNHDILQTYGLGNSEDEYLVGDWDGDGRDNLAVRRGNKVYMDTNFSGNHDNLIEYDANQPTGSIDEYLVGNWDSDSADELAVRVDYQVLMDFGNGGDHELTHAYGIGDSEDQYLVGNWDGISGDNLGIRRGDEALLAHNLDGAHDETRLFPI